MYCNTCNELLAEYKLWVTVFKDAVLNIPGVLGDDSRVFVEHADRLRLKCKRGQPCLEGAFPSEPRQEQGNFFIAVQLGDPTALLAIPKLA